MTGETWDYFLASQGRFMQTNRGSALLSALFIMTLIAIAATAMSTRLQLDIYRTRTAIESDQLYLASQAVTFWAMDALAMKKQFAATPNDDGKLLNFPNKLQRSYPNITTTGALYDLQARFNLNNLQDKKYHPLFLRLLEHTLGQKNESDSKSLMSAIDQWISAYQPDRGHESDVSYYLKQIPPYLPAHQLMQSVTELRLIRGINQKIYQRLLPKVTALPEITPININTASKSVLMGLGSGLNESQVNELILERGETGIKDMKDVSPLLEKLHIPSDQITIESMYYLSIATTTSVDRSLTTYSIIKRGKDLKGKVSIGLVSNTINTL